MKPRKSIMWSKKLILLILIVEKDGFRGISEMGLQTKQKY
jgi:hypothetical protein